MFIEYEDLIEDCKKRGADVEKYRAVLSVLQGDNLPLAKVERICEGIIRPYSQNPECDLYLVSKSLLFLMEHSMMVVGIQFTHYHARAAYIFAIDCGEDIDHVRCYEVRRDCFLPKHGYYCGPDNYCKEM